MCVFYLCLCLSHNFKIESSVDKCYIFHRECYIFASFNEVTSFKDSPCFTLLKLQSSNTKANLIHCFFFLFCRNTAPCSRYYQDTKNIFQESTPDENQLSNLCSIKSILKLFFNKKSQEGELFCQFYTLNHDNLVSLKKEGQQIGSTFIRTW